ncbi:hypothetical protein WDZ16_12510 [Pseudokineococcus marinus]|uniref:DUF559 domain-containing protein n=1 Tax=Pseudokineococcus marinus TaxID=351215 RepID=A0A849BVN2_9ACTN|nr:hypothetical protein [Pseudokineococcus marinus]NNH23556.1 hypothetical protein [Pseudokineococcus marinus]
MASSATGFPRVFIGSQAVAEGALTPKQLRGPSFVRVVPGVYAPADVPRDHALRVEGAGLVLPTEALVTGASAATVLGVPLLGWSDRVELVVPEEGGRHPVGRDVRVRRSRSTPGPGRSWRTTRLAPPERLAFDAAARESLPSATARLDGLARAGLVHLPRLGRWLEGRRDHGVVRVRAALALADPRAESAPESVLRVVLVLAGVDVDVQLDICDERGAFILRADLAVVGVRLAVLYDGAWHALRLQQEKDRRQDHALSAAGWVTLRITAADLAEPGRAVALVRAAAARAPSRPRS